MVAVSRVTPDAVVETDFPRLLEVGKGYRRAGKVRDVYSFRQTLLAETLGPGQLLFVATDRISAFDSVLKTPIPSKGKILTAMSAFWFERTKDVVPNHFLRRIDREWLSTSGTEIATRHDIDPREMALLEDRAMIVKEAQRLPVECIVRGYMAGSAWAEYQEHGTVCGVRLPAGLRESEQFPEPLFTPTTKADVGHDENMTTEQLVDAVGLEVASAVRLRSLALYRYGADFARERGIIIADTKFEFGLLDDGEPIVIDELLTPDSSRFWDADEYRPGRHQEAFDKQYVRDWLLEHGWEKEPSEHPLPSEIVEETARRYAEIQQRLIE